MLISKKQIYVPYKYLSTDAHSSFIYNSKELEITHMFISSSLDKQNEISILMDYYSGIKKKFSVDAWTNIDYSLRIIVLRERTHRKAYNMTL